MNELNSIHRPLREQMQLRLQASADVDGGMGVLVSFSGELGDHITESLLVLCERAVSATGSPRKRTKRAGQVLIESLQNVARHGWVDDDGQTPFFMALEYTPLGFQLQTGNIVDFDMASELRHRLAKVNGMNREELRKAYVERLCQGELSERGGAGLGLISMAKRSEGPLNYQFSEFGQGLFLFSLSVLIRN
jgi:hypothetical protein